MMEPMNREIDRRELLKWGAGALGVAAGAAVIGCGGSAGLSTTGTATTATATSATATTSTATTSTGGTGGTYADSDYINFLLNLEYIKAEYYLLGTTGLGLSGTLTGSKPGTVTGGSVVSWSTSTIQGLMTDLAQDEVLHVTTLKNLNGSLAISLPSINFTSGFLSLGTNTGLGGTFNAFASEENFLLGAFYFEDVAVTAQYGAMALMTTESNILAVAGMMGTDSYHAGAVRYAVYGYGSDAIAKAGEISGFRGSIGGGDDASLLSVTLPNIAPHDTNGYIYGRATRLVENIMYLTSGVAAGGFFPNGFAGNIVSSLQRRR